MGESVGLNRWEWQLLDRCGRGEVADFPRRGKKPVIRASVIRQLLLGLPIAGLGIPSAVRFPGVRVSGARVEGELDLSDCATPQAGLPALALDNCDIPQPILMESTRISRLSISGSRFRALNAREIEIDGLFDFSGASPFPTTDGTRAEAWIDMRSALINGEMNGKGARLRAPKPRDEKELAGGDRIYALRMPNADIRGSVLLRELRAYGGVLLSTALIRGDLFADATRLTAGEGFAFNVQSTVVGGLLWLDKCVAWGPLWLHSARVGGVVVDQACIYGQPLKSGLLKDWLALVADYADIRATARLRGVTTLGNISFANARIGGDLQGEELCLRGPLGSKRAKLLDLTNAKISDDVILSGTQTRSGSVALNGTSIGGNLCLKGSSLRNRSEDRTGVALEAINATVSKDVEFKTMDSGQRFTARGKVDLTGARIAGKLDLTGARISNQKADGNGCALIARRATIQGDLRFDDFEAKGLTELAGASIGNELLCKNARFLNSKRSAIYANDLEVGDNLKLHDTQADGDLRFERVDVRGSLEWKNLIISPCRINNNKAEDRPPLDLRHARIGTALKARSLNFRGFSRPLIHLGDMRVAIIEHSGLAGWGGIVGISACQSLGCAIDFDGLMYERIDHAEGSKPLDSRLATELRRQAGIPVRRIWRPKHWRADPLLDWILHQPRPKTHSPEGFFPQPFRQLARVLRAQGEEEAARVVAIAELWATPKNGIRRGWKYPFGALFGFGLSPLRATMVLIGYLAVGAAGVWAISENHFLIETPVAASTAYMMERGKLEHGYPRGDYVHPTLAGNRSGQVSAENWITELPCTDVAQNAFDDIVYAADLLVPFIPLHQETKCEIRRSDSVDRYSVARLAKALYSVIGWLVVSIWLLTVSGILKRSEREGD